MKFVDLLENPVTARHVPTALWLTSPKSRGEGRTTCLSIAFILNAIRYPGTKIEYFDHHDSGDKSKDYLRRYIQSLCDYVTVDRKTLICNRSASVLRELPKHKAREVVVDLIRSAVKLAKENNVDFEELVSIIRTEMISEIMEK